jgi:excisionase family DNA binding protein
MAFTSDSYEKRGEGCSVRDVTRHWLTPPELAAELAVKPATVLSWIRAGELKAINVARRGCARPRFRINRADLIAFEQARAAVPTTKIQRRRRRQPEGIIEFF